MLLFFETGFHCGALAGLKLTIYIRLALNLWQSSCLWDCILLLLSSPTRLRSACISAHSAMWQDSQGPLRNTAWDPKHCSSTMPYPLHNYWSLGWTLHPRLQVCQDLGTAGQAALPTHPYSCTILRPRPVSMASVFTSVSLNFYFSNYVSSVYSVNLMGQESFI